MSKYKLIKDFPNSPGLGCILDFSKTKLIKSKNNGVYDVNDIKKFPSFWEKIEEPLFMTEDGVNIYNGDAYCCVWEDEHNKFHYIKFIAERMPGKYSKKNLLFSTEKSASDWIKINESKYSIQNMCDIFYKLNWTSQSWEIFKKELK